MAMRLSILSTRHGKAARRVFMVLPALGLAILLFIGVGGWMQRDPSHIDMDVFYGAGTWYLDGISPYGRPRTPERLQALGLNMKAYAYSPHFAPLTMALAKLDYGVARIAWSALNVLAAAALAAVIVAMMYAERGRTRTDAPAAIMAAFLILASPFAASVLWLGNTSILVAACLAAGWWLDRQGRPIAAGLLLALAMIKPQFAVLPLIWLAWERRWSTLAACAIACVALFTYHAVVFGPIASVRDWLVGLAAYQELERPAGFQHLFGIGELVIATGFAPPPLWPLAILLVPAAWIVRHHLTGLEALAILSLLAVLLLPVRDYDLVVLAPLIGALAAKARGSLVASTLGLIGVGLFYMPQRMLRGLDVPVLLQWRVMVVLAMLGLLIVLIARRSEEFCATEPLRNARSEA